MRTTGSARSLMTFNPSPRRWPIALSTGLSMAVPVVVFALFGRTDLGLQASLGAFTAIYGGALPRAPRLRVLPMVAVALLAVVGLAVLLADSHPATLGGLAVVGVVATIVTTLTRLGPPGPIMFVLTYGVAAQLAAPMSLGGAGADPGLLALMVLVGAVSALLISAAVMFVPAVRWPVTGPPPAPVTGPRWLLDPEDRLTVTRMVVAVLLGVGLVAAIGEPRGYWVVGASLAILSIGHRRRITVDRAIHRIVGTIVGVGLFSVLALLHPQGVWLGLMLGGLQFVVELVVVRHYAVALTFITPLVLLLLSAAHPDQAGRIAVERLVDTGWGALLGLLVLVVVPQRWFPEVPPAEGPN
jgi:hypothetical protein